MAMTMIVPKASTTSDASVNFSPNPKALAPKTVAVVNSPDFVTFGDPHRLGILTRAIAKDAPPLSGLALLDAVIDDLAKRLTLGERVALVWDVDCTLFDPLPRMLATVHAYGRTDVQLDEVARGWRETAQTLGLNQERFYKVWDDYFWRPENFVNDRAIPQTSQRALRAQELGVHIFVSTGRNNNLLEATQTQLATLGLQPHHIFTKRAGMDTPSSKGEDMLELKAKGYHLGAFVTDRLDEIEGVNQRCAELVPELCHVLV